MPRNADAGTLCINCKEKIYDQNAEEEDFDNDLKSFLEQIISVQVRRQLNKGTDQKFFILKKRLAKFNYAIL